MSNIVLNIDIKTFGALANLRGLGSQISRTTGKASLDFKSFTSKITATSFAINNITDLVSKVGRAVDYPLQQFKEFESSMANVESLGVLNIDELKKSVLSLGTDEGIPLGFKNISDGLYQVVSAGVDAENQMSVLEASAKAGVAGIASTTDSLNFASAVVKGYGKSWSETTSILNQGFKTVKLGQTTFPELASNIGKLVAPMSSLNIGTYELFGSLATLTGITGNTSEVSTQLKAILVELMKPTDEMAELVKSYGHESVEAATKSKGLLGIIDMLRASTEGSAEAMNKFFGSSEAVTAALSLSGAQYEDFVRKTEEMKNSTGAMEEAFVINAATMENQALILENKFNKRLIEGVEFMSPFIIKLMEIGSTILDLDFTPLAVGVGTVSSAFVGLAISQHVASFGGFIPALKFAGFAFQYFSTIATASIASIPIVGWIAAGVTALGVLVSALYITSESEIELAEARKKNAQETIELIKQERNRAEQLILTGTEIDKNRIKVEKLTDELRRQQKIFADADKTKYKIEMEEAGGDIEFGIAITDYQARMNDLVIHHKNNYIAMKETVDRNIDHIITKLTDHETGIKKLSETEVEKLNNSKETWSELSETIDVAAIAQQKYNDTSRRLIELNRTTENSHGEKENTLIKTKIGGLKTLSGLYIEIENKIEQLVREKKHIEFQVDLEKGGGVLDVSNLKPKGIEETGHKKASDFQDLQELELNSIEDRFDRERAITNANHKADLEAYKGVTGAKEIIDDFYRKEKEKQDRVSAMAQLQTTQMVMSSMSGIFAEHTAFAKALALSQVVISGAQSQMAALQPPPVGLGPIWGWALLPAIIGQAAKQAHAITSTGSPSLPKGYKYGGRFKKGEAGYIEGIHNEIIAPEKTFIEIFERELRPQIYANNQISGAGVIDTRGIQAVIKSELSKFTAAMESKQWKIKGEDVVTASDRYSDRINRNTLG